MAGYEQVLAEKTKNDYSVIILTFNSQYCIERCLISLISAFSKQQKTYEIFIIDNGSVDNTRMLIARVRQEYNANINLILFDYNTGTTFSRNKGLSRAQGDFIIVVDSDAYVNAQAIGCLQKHLSTHQECGLAVPKLIYPDGRFQMSTDVFPTFWRKLMRFFFLKKIEKATIEEPSAIKAVDYSISAFWMMRKSVLDDVGLLDEKIFYSPEDVDYCIRVWKAGYRIDYLSQVKVIHDAQEISRTKIWKINRFTLSHLKGLLYLFIKHKYLFSGKKFRTSNRKAL